PPNKNNLCELFYNLLPSYSTRFHLAEMLGKYPKFISDKLVANKLSTYFNEHYQDNNIAEEFVKAGIGAPEEYLQNIIRTADPTKLKTAILKNPHVNFIDKTNNSDISELVSKMFEKHKHIAPLVVQFIEDKI